jgi:hypothetical protein
VRGADSAHLTRAGALRRAPGRRFAPPGQEVGAARLRRWQGAVKKSDAPPDDRSALDPPHCKAKLTVILGKIITSISTRREDRCRNPLQFPCSASRDRLRTLLKAKSDAGWSESCFISRLMIFLIIFGQRRACRMLKSKTLPTLAGAFGVLIAATPADASLVADGITYTLIETPLTATTAQFDLDIAGINGPSDMEGGRSGVETLGFTPPTNFSSATLLGFTEMSGGLNSMGCSGSGNFFCFKNNVSPPTSPALPLIRPSILFLPKRSPQAASRGMPLISSPTVPVVWTASGEE